MKTVLERVNSNEYLQSLWDAINVNAVRRLGLSDHGRVHFAIVANIALKILRNLIEADVKPDIVTDHKMTNDDAEVVVFLGAVLHDLGMVAHRENHHIFSVSLASQIMPDLLKGVYGDKERAIITAETLHTIYAHESEIPQFTLEAGVVRVADALDMKEGRARIPFTVGKKDIHALSAMSIRDIKIRKSKEKPVVVEISMYNESGIFQVDQLLKKKIAGTKIEKFIEVIAQVEKEQRKVILQRYTLGTGVEVPGPDAFVHDKHSGGKVAPSEP
ncbi:MAG TPA: HD domain-containing protein [Candidatus Bathyarchaeia archaeon]|nr:HD domain-containing protein [Candidatus Bathyarchaeia archaeon]